MKKKGTKVLFIILSAGMLFPVWMVFTGSFMGGEELTAHVAAILKSTEGQYADWSLLPLQPSLWSWIDLLLDTPEYFVVFWNTAFVTVVSVAGQTVAAILTAWGIAVYRFRGKQYLRLFYTVMMMLPFQVMMLPQYLLFKQLHLYDSFWAVILPEIFSPFAVFLLLQNFKALPGELLEAARIDGAGEWALLKWIGIPYAKGGIITVALLGFLECWGMIEQPNAFIEERGKMLLAEYLPRIEMGTPGFALAASALTLIPCILVMTVCAEYLREGLKLS